MQVKLKDLAEKTGYSITTVSRALAGYSDVSEKTRQHILAVASSVGYQPNLVARQLRSQRTHTLGLIIPANERSFSNDFFTQLMLAVGDTASPEHYDLLISAQAPGEEEMAASPMWGCEVPSPWISKWPARPKKDRVHVCR